MVYCCYSIRHKLVCNTARRVGDDVLNRWFGIVFLSLGCFFYDCIQKILRFSRIISTMGKYSMEMFLIHSLVYSQIGKRFFALLSECFGFGINETWILTWIISLLMIILLAIPTKKIIGIIYKVVSKLCLFLRGKIFLKQG